VTQTAPGDFTHLTAGRSSTAKRPWLEPPSWQTRWNSERHEQNNVAIGLEQRSADRQQHRDGESEPGNQGITEATALNTVGQQFCSSFLDQLPAASPHQCRLQLSNDEIHVQARCPR
jgi:hypothetical protein